MAGDKCDLLITNAVVYDGTGAAPRKGDVAVRADRIVAVGRLDGWYAAETLDANGLALAPGFIDAHTHDDRAVLSTPEMSAKVSQGVTTVIGGNCGISIAPGIGREPPPPLNLLGNREWFRFDRVADYFEAVEASPPALNIALLVGHSTLRAATMDKLDRPATPAEIERMGELLDEAMKANRDGQAADFDVYPYTASSTVLLAHFME
ncbi:MAG: amidohydrolase family protein, partial [Chromatiales bacterium]|nr:amidohydrolase family protein [Chromatiales bacterium]